MAGQHSSSETTDPSIGSAHAVDARSIRSTRRHAQPTSDNDHAVNPMHRPRPAVIHYFDARRRMCSATSVALASTSSFGPKAPIVVLIVRCRLRAPALFSDPIPTGLPMRSDPMSSSALIALFSGWHRNRRRRPIARPALPGPPISVSAQRRGASVRSHTAAGSRNRRRVRR